MKFGIWIFLGFLLISSCLETSPSKGDAHFSVANVSLDTIGSETVGIKNLSGEELPGLRFSKRKMQQLDANSLKMEKLYIQYPDSFNVLMNYARSLDKKGAFIEAKNIYQIGERKFPKSAELYQYKGLNEIMARDFKTAVKDLQTAVFYNSELAIRSDLYQDQSWVQGTAQFYSWYYLGLAYYLNRNYDSAISSFKKCLSHANADDDLMVIPFFWLYNIYQEIGNPEAAQAFLKDIDTNMLIVKSKDYYRGLLLFKGIFKPDRLTRFTVNKSNQVVQPIQAYALIRWYQSNNQLEKATSLSTLLVSSNAWNNLGYIACEADLFTNQNLN